MPGVLEDYQALKNKAIRMNADYQAIQLQLRGAEKKLQEMTESLEDYREQFRIQYAATELLKRLVEEKSQNHLKQLTSLLTFALQTIFFDREYQVELVVDDKRGLNTAEFYLLETMPDGSIIRSPIDRATGGSIRTVLGFVLQIYYISYYGLAPIVFLDEAFGALSEEYLPTLAEFMNRLTERRGFIFVLITHDVRIAPYAKRVYRVENGTVRLVQGGSHASS